MPDKTALFESSQALFASIADNVGILDISKKLDTKKYPTYSDFKTANKFREEAWVQNYFQQCTAYAIMYEELFGKPIEQIVVLIASEDGTSQAFIKEKKNFVADLKENIQGFYKYYQEQNKDKIKQE